MTGLATPLIGLASAVLLAATLAPGALGSSPSSAPTRSELAWAGLVADGKGDRLSSPKTGGERAAVSSVELLEGIRTTIVFRDHEGNVLFRSDPIAGTTVIAKNVDLPVVSVQPSEKPPLARQPRGDREDSETPTRTERQRNPAGCESAVSSLARGHGAAPGLCLAALVPTGLRS